ncbi:Transposon TX1 uncharacterized 149 kDa protein [Linum grandiflorum]
MIITVVGVCLSCDFHTRTDQLNFIAQFCTQIKTPFVICGDFNAILAHSEKLSFYNPVNNNDNRSIDGFHQFVHRLSLTDLLPSGPLFTWSNRQVYEVKSRLDRFLLSPNWITLFPHSIIHHRSDNGSDHRAIFHSDTRFHLGPKRYFSVDQRWLTNSEANSIVFDAWRSYVSKDSKLFNFYSKLKFLRHSLVDWQKGSSSNSARNIKSLKDELALVKSGPDIQWDNIRKLERKLEQELRLEDAYWKTKARRQWMLQGDRNTKYYHMIATFNRNKMHINKLRDNNGSFWCSEEDKQRLAIDYFKGLFTSDHPPGFSPSHLCPLFCKSVSSHQNAILIKPVSDQEIKEAVFLLGPNQAPGSDGFAGSFYRHFWDLIRFELCNAI